VRILIADDDPTALELLSEVLSARGHEVTKARDGREALDALKSDTQRLVICDWEMPELSGLELCRAIRTLGLSAYTYVIMLTARDGDEATVEALASGADDFITKPFNPDVINLRVLAAERLLSLETRNLAIFALAKLAESRDPETGAHLERVRSYSRVLANRLATHERHRWEINDRFIAMIYDTSPLHDIGKVAIPDRILLKPGRLTDEEFDIMKTHTTCGAQTLDETLRHYPEAGFLRMARDIAAHHHERYDGSGYPDGLQGEAIPLAARIVAVADVYDALVSKRVYKNAMDHDVARSIIVSDSGSHFDPAVVDAFVAMEDVFIEIAERYQDDAETAVAA
jgi:putative two-component system response regulator